MNLKIKQAAVKYYQQKLEADPQNEYLKQVVANYQKSVQHYEGVIAKFVPVQTNDASLDDEEPSF